MNISELVKLLDNKSLVIADKDIRKYISDYYKDTLVPFEMMDYSSFYQYGTFDLNSKTITEFMDIGYSYEYSKVLVNNYYIYKYFEMNEDLYKEEDIKILNNNIQYYEFLSNKYLHTDIVFINPDKSNDFYEISKAIYKNIKEYQLDINNLNNIYITKCLSIDEEVNNLFSSINDFSKDIYILCPESYYSTIEKYSKLYNVNVCIKNRNPLDSYSIVKKIKFSLIEPEVIDGEYKVYAVDEVKDVSEFINNYISNLELNEEEKDIVDKVISVINNVLGYEPSNMVIFYELLSCMLHEVNYVKYIDSNIKVYDSICEELLIKANNKDLYILDCSDGIIPCYLKDNEYISDYIRKKYNLNDIVFKNQYIHDNYINLLNRFNNLYISYNTTDHKVLASIIDDIKDIYSNIKIYNKDFKYNNKYSSKLDDLLYGRLMDNNIKYNIKNDYINEITNTNRINKYLSYNHSFNGSFKIDKPIQLSYTNLDTFDKCKYYYYLKYILKITDRKDMYYIYFGDFFHNMLEMLLNKKITLADLDEETDKFLNKNFKSEIEYDVISFYYHNQLKELLENAYYYILEYQKKSSFKEEDIHCEKEYEIPLNNKYKDTLYGKLDKVMSYKALDGKIHTVVIDYKTGNISLLNRDKLENGLSFQLPFYIYLLNNENPDNFIIGAFLQKIIPNDNIFNIDEFSKDEVYFKTLRYTGLINSEYSTEISSDDSLIYKPFKKNNNYITEINEENNQKLISLVEKYSNNALNDIHEGKFEINPKELNGEEISCKYCPYKGICNKDYKDMIILDSAEDESNE